MRVGLFYLGRSLQILGMLVVLKAFLSFFGQQNMGDMMKTTAVGVAEFYLGYYLVVSTGEKTDD